VHDRYVVVTRLSGARLAIEKGRLGNFGENIAEELTDEEVESESTVTVEYTDNYNTLQSVVVTTPFDEVLAQSGWVIENHRGEFQNLKS
jgi:hypothetical protein